MTATSAAPICSCRFPTMSARTRSAACSKCSHPKPEDNGSTRRHSGRCCGCEASSATRLRGSPKRSLCAKSSPDQLGKARRGPTEHVGLDLIERVPSFDHQQTTDLFPARATIDLGRTPDVELRVPLDHERVIDAVEDDAAPDPETSDPARTAPDNARSSQS